MQYSDSESSQLDPALQEKAHRLTLSDDLDAGVQQQVLQKSRRKTTVLINLVSCLERMDEQMVPAVSRWLGCAFKANPAQIGTITFARAVVQALSSPLGGILGHHYSRIRVIFAGCMVWGCCTLLFSTSTSIHQGSFYWAFNGIGLSLIIPSTQSLTADYYSADSRGTAFGALQLTGALGGMMGSLYATSIGDIQIGVIPGWRFAFMSVGLISMLVGSLTLLFGVDPMAGGRHTDMVHQDSAAELQGSLSQPLSRQGSTNSRGFLPLGSVLCGFFTRKGGHDAELQPLAPKPDTHVQLSGSVSAAPVSSLVELDCLTAPSSPSTASHSSSARLRVRSRKPSPGAKVSEAKKSMLREIWDLITIPSFLIIILQGITGSTPWNALVFLTLYLQLLGMTDATAGGLLALFIFGTAVGSLLGGWLGDKMGQRYPNHGRIFLAQFSVTIGIPFTFLLLKGLPLNADPATVTLYAAVLFTQGSLISWTGPCCNGPTFADIVPVRLRSMIYAFDRGFEGSISAMGAPLVGLFAQHYFGFIGTASTKSCENAGARPANGTALTEANTSGGHVGRLLMTVASAADPVGTHAENIVKAKALGNAMLVWMVGPWALCALTYTGLHWTYPKDKRKVSREDLDADDAAGQWH